jgi:hypothetical protein
MMDGMALDGTRGDAFATPAPQRRLSEPLEMADAEWPGSTNGAEDRSMTPIDPRLEKTPLVRMARSSIARAELLV